MKKVIVTKLSRAIRHVVSRGAQGPRGGLWAGWADIPDKPNFDALYDPLGAADAAQSAAAADATSKVNAHEGAADPHAQYALDTDLSGHTGNTSNPHGVTKDQVGLGNVDNTSDASKPVSTAQQNALNGKEPTITAGTSSQFWRGDKTWADFAANVRITVLTGLSTASASVITAADSVLGAIGKLQAQISDVITQTEAETGTSTTRRSWTSQRVRQAAAAWWEAVKGTLTGPVAISANSASDALRINQTGAGNALVVEDSSSPDSTPFVITGSGNVVVGATAPRNIGVTPIFSIEGLGSSATTMLITRNSADTSPCTFRAVKSRGTANGALDAIGSSDSILQLTAYGTDGTGHDQAASVTFGADGAVSTGIVPGRIIFYTANSAGALTEVFRVDSSQVLALTSGKLKLALNAGATKLLQSDASGNAAWGPAVGQADAALPTNSDIRAYYGSKFNPGVLPTFEMDFENARFSLYDAGDDGVYSTSRHFDEFAAWFGTGMQITRASTQTYFDALGNMREAPVNTVRCDHDPLTGRKLGVYVGESRVNRLYPSSGFSVSSTTSGGTIARGLLSLTEYTESTATTTRVVSSIAGSTFWEVGVRKTLSCYAMVKAGSAQRYLIMRDSATLAGVVFNLVTGAVHSVGSGWSATSQDLGGGLFRMSATYTNTGAAAVAATIAMSSGTNPAALTYAGDGVSGAWLGGVQGESGSSASPLILTTGSQVTRAATTLTVSGTKFSGMFNPRQGTFMLQYNKPMREAQLGMVMSVGDGTTQNRMYFITNNSAGDVFDYFEATTAGVAQGSTGFAATTVGRAAFSYANNNVIVGKNSTSYTDSTFAVPAVNKLDLGHRDGASQINGHLTSVTYYPVALSTTPVVELAK